MRISVFGLGYVGTVSAACLASRSHHVIGVDVNPVKVDLVNEGKSPFVEPDLELLIQRGIRSERLRATTDWARAVAETDLSFVCVGTPSVASGAIDLRAVVGVCKQIGEALNSKSSRHTVVIRSTVLPGTFRDRVIPELERASGKTAQLDFDVGCNPEFLREGTAVADFMSPAKTVVGADSLKTSERILDLYTGLPGPVVSTTPEVAEFIKYVDNPWHALKVAFANEIGNLCSRAGVDSRAVMDIFCLDEKLNISTAYLKPGFAFGGSCLPKDLRALTHLARNLDLEVPVLQSVLESNDVQVKRALDFILGLEKRRIGVLGCAFKMSTDDMRESPFVELVERLIGKGRQVKIFDPNVRLSAVMGANKEYLTNKLPHISSILVATADEATTWADIVLLTSPTPEYINAVSALREEQTVVDFVGLTDRSHLRARYEGINW